MIGIASIRAVFQSVLARISLLFAPCAPGQIITGEFPRPIAMPAVQTLSGVSARNDTELPDISVG
jgi:hypothetical protein